MFIRQKRPYLKSSSASKSFVTSFNSGKGGSSAPEKRASKNWSTFRPSEFAASGEAGNRGKGASGGALSTKGLLDPSFCSQKGGALPYSSLGKVVGVGDISVTTERFKRRG